MIYLPESQQLTLRRRTNELPERKAAPPTYPFNRLRGTVRLPSGQVLQGPPIPIGPSGGQIRLLNFYFRTTATSRRAFSLPKCRGPAVILDMMLGFSPGVDPPDATLELGTSLTPISEAGVSLATPRPYNVLTEFTDPFAFVTDSAGGGFPLGTPQAPTTRPLMPLNLPITLTEFYPVIAALESGISVINIMGYLRIIEGVSLADLSAFH